MSSTSRCSACGERSCKASGINRTSVTVVAKDTIAKSGGSAVGRYDDLEPPTLQALDFAGVDVEAINTLLARNLSNL